MPLGKVNESLFNTRYIRAYWQMDYQNFSGNIVVYYSSNIVVEVYLL